VTLFRKFRAKIIQSRAFLRSTRTAVPLVLDSFKLKRSPFIAETKQGLRLELMPRCGDSFTFYENLIRHDYLRHGIELKAGDVVVDIGANIGAFTVLAAAQVGPSGRVFAFEPSSAVYDRLLRNLELNHLSNVTPIKCAVGGENGRAKLELGVKSAYATICHGIDGRQDQSPTEDVEVRRLSDIVREHNIDRIDLLKMDCEGAEYAIFDTLEQTLAATVRQIAMEVHDISGRNRSTLLDRLRQLGFTVQPTYPLTAMRGSSNSQAAAFTATV